VQYFEQHLPTQLQQQVATALFIDGLPPREIATLMKKQPSEVRSIKSRLVNKLQALPDEEKSRLKEILGVGGTIS
jgi:DNA-directed RNA polymerase specialized sigma24 family protein